jgi:hypothetical protein
VLIKYRRAKSRGAGEKAPGDGSSLDTPHHLKAGSIQQLIVSNLSVTHLFHPQICMAHLPVSATSKP